MISIKYVLRIHMPADKKQLAQTEKPELEAGQTLGLSAGDDLALAALNQAQTAGPTSSADDEVKNSDQIAETLTSLQSIIERNANLLDELKDKLKETRDSLRSMFENDTELTAAQEQAQSYTAQIKERKVKLLADATVVRLQTQVAELTEQKKELEESLSNHLVNYYDLTKSTSFDTSDGDQREFVIKATVKRSRSRSHAKD